MSLADIPNARDQAISQENGGPTVERRNGVSSLVEVGPPSTLLESPEGMLEVGRKGNASKRVLAANRQLRVLIADDYKDTADSMGMLVKLWGHDVRMAFDGAAALEMASAYQPDVIVLDIGMPILNGYQVARQLRRQTRFKDTLLIAITGYADEAHRLLWQEAFDHYLIKPLEVSTLENLLVLQQRRQRGLQIPPPPQRPNGVLIVDDDPFIRDVLGVGMRQEGFTVWLAANGWEALDLYQCHCQTIDVVLLDVLMPGRDGPETLATLKEVNPQVRCCFLSGSLGIYTEERLQTLGAAAVLEKPFRLDEVAQVFRHLASNGQYEPVQPGAKGDSISGKMASVHS